MAMINYADKVALNQNSNIADINKCNASDLNEIKNSFNNQVAFGWYQTGLSPTFTYVSWDSSVRTGVVNSNLDLTSYLSVGMKVKFTQNSVIKYAFITAITSTQLTLFLGTDYSLNNSAISNSYYSMLKAPFGFDINPEKWMIKVTSSSNLSTASPTQNIWYNKLTLNVPIGNWNVDYQIAMGGFKVSATSFTIYATLSTANNSESDKEFSNWINIEGALGTIAIRQTLSKSKYLLTTSKTPYYLNIKTDATGITDMKVFGVFVPAVLRAVCAYL